MEEKNEQPFHIVLKTGQAISIKAARFEHHVNPEDRFLFFDGDDNPYDQVFLRADAVTCVIPQSVVAEFSPFLELNARIEDHEARIRAIEEKMAQ